MAHFETHFGQLVREQMSDDFKSDLKDLLALPGTARRALAETAVESWLARTEKERATLRQECFARLKAESAVLGRPLELLTFFADIFLSETDPASDDDPATIAADIAAWEGVLPGGIRAHLSF